MLKTVLTVVGIFGLLLLVGLLFDISSVNSQTTAVTLDFTAPGDDGVVGTASTYQMRYATTRPDTTSQATIDSWWATATNVTSLPVPLVAGTRQSVTVTASFQSGVTYYFIMKACDEVPNCSVYSNVASKFIPDNIPPARISDLVPR